MLAIEASPWHAVGPIGTWRAAGRLPPVSAPPADRRFAPPAIRHSAFKDRVAALSRAGAGHPEVRSRYRLLAERYPVANLDTAIILVDRMRRAELDRRERAIRAWGHCSSPRLALMLLDELRLILRLVRRRAPTRYPAFVAAVLGADGAAQGGDVLTGEAAE